MKNTILKFGGYGLLTGVIIFLLILWLGHELSFSAQEALGYLTMIGSLSFIYFGLKHYGDKENNGALSIGKGIFIGVLISALVGLGIGLADYIYTTVINPNFATEYLETALKALEASATSAEQLEIQKTQLTQQMEAYSGSGFMAFIMFLTVVLIGFIISLISAIILQRKK